MRRFVIFARLKRDFFANLADCLGGDVEERGDVLQVEVLHDAGAALHQQVVALAGRGAMEVDIHLLCITDKNITGSGIKQDAILFCLKKYR